MKQKDVDKIDKKIIADYIIPAYVALITSGVVSGLILIAIQRAK